MLFEESGSPFAGVVRNMLILEGRLATAGKGIVMAQAKG